LIRNVGGSDEIEFAYLLGGISFTSNKKRKRKRKRKRREYANILNMGRHVFDTVYMERASYKKYIEG
jgi:hypothetical protein